VGVRRRSRRRRRRRRRGFKGITMWCLCSSSTS